jgi:uncharacterized protein YdhG (YjbR/CyaY superfamily)
MAGSGSVDEYLRALPAPQRAALEGMRATIRAAAPKAAESIAYEMPTFRADGRFLVSYAAFKNHYSLFPASSVVVDELGDAIRPYLSGKGTIRFPANEPIPTQLVARVVEIRVREVAAAPARGAREADGATRRRGVSARSD